MNAFLPGNSGFAGFARLLAAAALLATAGHALAGVVGVRPAAPQQRATAPVVLPAMARPFGYSLEDMSRLTAAFNIGDRSGPPPSSPFQILYQNLVTGATHFEVPAGKMLYVPVLFTDNSLPLLGNYPANSEDRRQALPYWFSQTELGVTTMQVIVDGRPVALGAPYVVGVGFGTPLANGATQYMGAAAFVPPLVRGAHTVEIRGKATGDALRKPPFDEYFPEGFFEFSLVYDVIVR